MDIESFDTIDPSDQNLKPSEWESLLESSSDEETSNLALDNEKEEEEEVEKQQKDVEAGENEASSSNRENDGARTSAMLPTTSKSSDKTDDTDSIILSLTYAKSNLAAAYYNMNTSELFVMDDVAEDEFSYHITKVLYKQTQPRYVLIINGTTDAFINVIKKLIVQDVTDENNQSSQSISSRLNCASASTLKFLPKNDNNYDHCYHRVQCLKLECELENSSNADRIIFLNSMLNFKSRLMVQALGMLLRYLDENWNKLSLNHSGQAQYIAINTIKLEDLVMIEEETYKLLNIVQSKYHPSLFKYGKPSKEQGASLFTFLNRCQSRVGSMYLWKLMRRPTRDIQLLQDRHRAIEFFLHIDNQHVVQSLKSSLQHVYRLTATVINKYSTAHAKASEWNRFHTTLSNVIYTSEICSQYRHKASIFAKIADSITEGIHYTRYFIDHIIDFEMSKKLGKFTVRAGVDIELDELNHIKRSLPQRLTEVVQKELENLPANIETCRIIYVPDIQYCLGIISWTGTPPDDEMMPGLEFKFAIKDVRYYKSQGTRELDETIGDIAFEITKRQSQIMLRLVNFVNKNIGLILKSIEYCAELDTLLSLAQVARDHNYVKPEMIKAHKINIKGGRHPLAELYKPNFVPNNTYSGKDGSFIKIFSGPNACGKTVYLKQVALIVYMAHIGCFLPVESATIGVVTHILIQMPTSESTAQNASAFLIDLRQIHNILYSSTPNSLIIMDEFGKGTAQIDALALLTNILINFIDRGKHCPHIFVATHIHRVIELLPKINTVEAQTFEFMLNEDNTLVFLYRLISGNVALSFAHAVAESAGLSQKLVKNAISVFDDLKKGKLSAPRPRVNEFNAVKYIVTNTADQNNQINLDILEQKIEQALIIRK